MNNKFTILSSCFNKVQYLNDWANSILVQKYRPLEVVIANDCSTDGSLTVLTGLSDKFKNKDIEYKIINNKKKLQCGSSYRNLVKKITGSYCGVLDSDDMLVDDAVEYVMGLYNKYPDIGWIYTQFDTCNRSMKSLHKGISRAPREGMSMLDMGEMRKHTYSHWRTFNRKIIKPTTLFGKHLKCAVDKYMGYRLEELAPGMFVDRVCYKYREGVRKSVAGTEATKKTWKRVVVEARDRRNKKGSKPFPIIIHKES
jgi:glycosyltransferase involved in cell wall biosynthesis